MSSVLDTSVLSTAGRLVGRNCSGIPFKLSDRVLLKRALLWKKMQEKYEQWEENSLNQETISINKLGDCSVKSLSSSCNEVVPLSTHIESPGGSWEDRKKYRKSKDSVQHWINTSSHAEHANQISPFAHEWPKLSSSASGEESAYVSSNTNICLQERDTSIKFLSKEFKNVDIVSGMTEEDHMHDGFGEEEEPIFRKRSAEQSLENCSKIWDTKSERFITGSIRVRHLTHSFINCNKRSLSRNRILFPADKGTPLPKKIILPNCDKSAVLTNGEQLAADRVCIPKTETTAEICNNNNQTLREKELAPADIKSTRKQIMENHEKGQNAACDTDAGRKHKKNQISGYENHVCSGEEVSILRRKINKENVDTPCIRKGSQSTVKEVPAYRKGTLIQNDTRTQSVQKMLSGIEQNKQNSGAKEKPMLRYGRKKIIKSCDTDATLRKDKFLFSGEEIAISRRKENETLREARLLFSDTETSTSEETRDVEKCSKGPVSWKEKPLPSDSNTTESGAKSNVVNCYTRPFQREEDTKAEVNVGYSSSGRTARKNKLLTIDKQILLPAVQDKPSVDDKESLDYVRLQVLDSGEKNETSAVGFLLGDAEQRDSVAGQECYRRNPVSISRQLCEQNAASELVESCTEIERQRNILSGFAGLLISDEDCVEQSLDDASTVIIHPLLSCKYEHEVVEIRKKLKDLYEVLKDKDRGPLVIHDDRNSSPSYSCNSERSRLQHKRISVFTERKNKRRKLNLDIKHEQLSYVSETLSQSEDSKYYGHLESGDRNVLPINVSKKDMPKLSTDEQEDTSSTKNENGAKNVFRCTSLQSEKEEDNINTSCSKIGNSGSQTVSSRNNSSTKSTGHLVTSLQFGTKKIKHSHCNLDNESHDLEMGSKRDRETSNPAVVSGHDDDGETTDDDDIFYYRRPRNSPLLCEKEINKKTIYSDSQNKSARNTSEKLSGHSVASKHCTDDRKVFSDSSDHRETETSHSVIGLEHERTESNAAGCDENTQKKCMLIRRKRETRSSNSSVKSKHNENGHVSNDNKSPKQENVLTKSKRRATALNNLVRSKYEENGYDISDDSEVPQNRKILHRWKRRSYTSYHLIASDHDKNKGNTSDDGKLLNMENVSSRLKRRMKALNSAAVGCNHNETKDVSRDAENPKKENVPSRRKNRMKMCINSDGSKYDQNESHVTDDGKSPEKENVLKRRERGTETYNLIASEYDETDKTVILSDVGYPSKNESEMTGMSKHHEYYDDVDDNDDIFYTTPKRSLLYKKEKEKTDNSCNENCTSLKSSRNNGHKSVRNSSSQSTLTRNVFRKSLKHSLKSVVWKNENIVDKDNSIDEKSAEIDLLTDSHRQQSSGDIIEKNHSSHKSDDNMHKMKMDSKLMESSRTETRKVSSVGSEHIENEEDMTDDDIFYKTPRRSSLYGKERGRVSSICGNENHTSLKSNKANKNNSSQDLSCRNTNMSRESDKCLFNSVTFRNENRADKDSSSDISSADIEDILTDSNRRQFSGDIMEKIGSCNKSGDIHKIHMESKFMKSSRTETQKDSSTSSEHPENEEKVMEHEDEDDDDDIFCYRTRKQSLPCRKEKK